MLVRTVLSNASGVLCVPSKLYARNPIALTDNHVDLTLSILSEEMPPAAAKFRSESLRHMQMFSEPSNITIPDVLDLQSVSVG
jgi:hypothetical protein